MEMTKLKVFAITMVSLCLAAASAAAASEAQTHIKASNKDNSIVVTADIETPAGYEGPVTSIGEDTTYFEDVETGKWASFTCITYMSAEEMEKAYDEENGDNIIPETTHSVKEASEAALNGTKGSKRSVETLNPVTNKMEHTIVGIFPKGDGCLVVKTSAPDAEYEQILACVKNFK